MSIGAIVAIAVLLFVATVTGVIAYTYYLVVSTQVDWDRALDPEALGGVGFDDIRRKMWAEYDAHYGKRFGSCEQNARQLQEAYNAGGNRALEIIEKAMGEK